MDDAAAQAAEHWGLAATAATRLPSEVDETYRVRLADGTAVILKLSEPGRAAEELAFEADLVEAALAVDAGLPLARTLPDRAGRTLVPLGDRWLRVVQHLPGAEVATASPELTARIGAAAGRLAAALAGVQDARAHRPVAWDLRRLAAVPVGSLPEDVRRDVDAVRQGHAALCAAAAELPAHVLHGDANAGNVLILDGEVSGIVDFGDAHHMPRVFDVGVGMAYAHAYAEPGHPWQGPLAFLRGYRRHVALLPEELALLPAVVRARAAQRVLMAAVAQGTGRDEGARLAAASAHLGALVHTDPAEIAEEGRSWSDL